MADRYDLSLSWSPEMNRQADEGGPSIFTAVQEQLGLKLESAKEPVLIFLLDHIEPPAEN